MRIFQDFFRFGEAMDPDAPERAKGLKRAAGGVVYAPVKGLVYGGKSVLSGVIMGSAAVVAGAGAMVANVAFGVKEMGEAGVNAARSRKSSKPDADTDSSAEAPNVEGASPSRRRSSGPMRSNALTCACAELANEKPAPSFMNGLKKATVGAVAAPVAVRACTRILLLAVVMADKKHRAHTSSPACALSHLAGHRDRRRRAARKWRRCRRLRGRRVRRRREQRRERRARGEGGQQDGEAAPSVDWLAGQHQQPRDEGPRRAGALVVHVVEPEPGRADAEPYHCRVRVARSTARPPAAVPNSTRRFRW